MSAAAECGPLSTSPPEKSFEPGMAWPLDGLRVTDLSRLVSGNMVNLRLADFGAEVNKIEDPVRSGSTAPPSTGSHGAA